MINKKKFLFFNRITIIVLILLVLLVLIKFTLASFETSGEGEAVSSVAFYVVDVGSQTQNLILSDVKPDDTDNYYSISVSNFASNKVSEVSLEYSLSIKTTTNIPITYSLYKNDDSTNILGDREVITDNDKMYFFKYNSISSSFDKGVKKTDNYKLVINFPSDYNSEDYQDLIDNITISVDAKQV